MLAKEDELTDLVMLFCRLRNKTDLEFHVGQYGVAKMSKREKHNAFSLFDISPSYSPH